MSLRTHCIVGVLLPLLAATPMSGQSADLISGRWTGEAGPANATERQPITLDLRVDSAGITGNLSGPARPGVIRTGSFDPFTGSLRLEVSIEGSDGPLVVFEGLVVTGTALGRVTGDGIAGDFKVSRVGAARPATDPSAAAARSAFVQVHAGTANAIRMRTDMRRRRTVLSIGCAFAESSTVSLMPGRRSSVQAGPKTAGTKDECCRQNSHAIRHQRLLESWRQTGTAGRALLRTIIPTSTAGWCQSKPGHRRTKHHPPASRVTALRVIARVRFRAQRQSRAAGRGRVPRARSRCRHSCRPAHLS